MEKNTSRCRPPNAELREAALEYHRSPVRAQDLGDADQAAGPTSAISARLLARRRLCLPGHRGETWRWRPTSLAAATRRRGHQRYWRYWAWGDIGLAGRQAGDEGKSCLFQKFAGIDVFDIELAEKDPDKLARDHRRARRPAGDVNLEDIKAPESFTTSACASASTCNRKP